MVVYSVEFDYFAFVWTRERPVFFYLNTKNPQCNMWLHGNSYGVGHEIFQEIRGF